MLPLYRARVPTCGRFPRQQSLGPALWEQAIQLSRYCDITVHDGLQHDHPPFLAHYAQISSRASGQTITLAAGAELGVSVSAGLAPMGVRPAASLADAQSSACDASFVAATLARDPSPGVAFDVAVPNATLSGFIRLRLAAKTLTTASAGSVSVAADINGRDLWVSVPFLAAPTSAVSSGNATWFSAGLTLTGVSPSFLSAGESQVAEICSTSSPLQLCQSASVQHVSCHFRRLLVRD